MIGKCLSTSGIMMNGYLDTIIDNRAKTLQGRLGCVDPVGPLYIRLERNGALCRCRLNLRVPGEALHASTEHATVDAALDRAFEALFRQAERARSAKLLRNRAA